MLRYNNLLLPWGSSLPVGHTLGCFLLSLLACFQQHFLFQKLSWILISGGLIFLVLFLCEGEQSVMAEQVSKINPQWTLTDCWGCCFLTNIRAPCVAVTVFWVKNS